MATKEHYRQFKLQGRTTSDALFINLPLSVTKFMGWEKGNVVAITQIENDAIKVKKVKKK